MLGDPSTTLHGQMGVPVDSPMGTAGDPNQRGNSRRWIIREVENSLRRLDTDCIDLYQVHRPDQDTDVEETLSALTDLQRQGKIRAFGSSTLPARNRMPARFDLDAPDNNRKLDAADALGPRTREHLQSRLGAAQVDQRSGADSQNGLPFACHGSGNALLPMGDFLGEHPTRR